MTGLIFLQKNTYLKQSFHPAEQDVMIIATKIFMKDVSINHKSEQDFFKLRSIFTIFISLGVQGVKMTNISLTGHTMNVVGKSILSRKIFNCSVHFCWKFPYFGFIIKGCLIKNLFFFKFCFCDFSAHASSKHENSSPQKITRVL